MHFSGEPDLQGQRLKYLPVKRGKGNSENFHCSLYHVKYCENRHSSKKKKSERELLNDGKFLLTLP